MASQLFYPIPSVLGQGTMTATRLANAKLRLFKAGFTPSFGTTLAELNAVECDFSGYPAGGISITSWSAPILGPPQGAMITAGLLSFAMSGSPPAVTNSVGGFYLVTADNVLWMVAEFPDSVPMQVEGQGLPIALSVGFGSQ